MKTFAAVILWISILPPSLKAQTCDPLSFFPHRGGDLWERTGVFLPSHVWQVRILEDSLGGDGHYYVHHSDPLYGRVRIDTTSLEVRRNIGSATDYPYLIYKLDADSGETWIRSRLNQYATMARVVGVYAGLFWGEIRTVKEIDIADSASGLLFATEYLASGLGLVGYDIDAFPDWRLSGAIINGTRYGRITLHVQDPNPRSVESFVLSQNYPNPFNPSTTIKYQLAEDGIATLKVFDILGREVATIAEGIQSAGYYSATFNADRLASGVYFLRFTVADEMGRTMYTKMSKLLLVR